jgi:hypothetical protein
MCIHIPLFDNIFLALISARRAYKFKKRKKQEVGFKKKKKKKVRNKVER